MSKCGATVNYEETRKPHVHVLMMQMSLTEGIKNSTTKKTMHY